jgi:hypothetical protein
VALIVHDAGLNGAVNRPVDEIVPQEVVKLAPLLAVNCCVPPSVTVGDRGLMVNVVVPGAAIVSNPYAVYFTVPVAIASMVQLVPTVPLAVNRPVELMVPHLAVHDTGMLAVNCWVCPCGVLADGGVMMIAETTVTFAVLLPLPFVAVAVTVQVVLGYSGAVKRPAEETDPQVFDHVAAEVAVNCFVAFSWTVAVAGEIANVVDVGAVMVSNP